MSSTTATNKVVRRTIEDFTDFVSALKETVAIETIIVKIIVNGVEYKFEHHKDAKKEEPKSTYDDYIPGGVW